MSYRFGPEDLHQLRILVVEDDHLMGIDLAEALAARGAEVIGPAASLEEARSAVAANWIDRAVLDIDLGGEASFPIADRLDSAGIPYVIASGCAPASLPERFRGKPRLEKPFRHEALVELLAMPDRTGDPHRRAVRCGADPD